MRSGDYDGGFVSGASLELGIRTYRQCDAGS